DHAAVEAWIGTDPARQVAVATLQAAWDADARRLGAPYDVDAAWRRFETGYGGPKRPGRWNLAIAAAVVAAVMAAGAAWWLGRDTGHRDEVRRPRLRRRGARTYRRGGGGRRVGRDLAPRWPGGDAVSDGHDPGLARRQGDRRGRVDQGTPRVRERASGRGRGAPGSVVRSRCARHRSRARAPPRHGLVRRRAGRTSPHPHHRCRRGPLRVAGPNGGHLNDSKGTLARTGGRVCTRE